MNDFIRFQSYLLTYYELNDESYNFIRIFRPVIDIHRLNKGIHLSDYLNAVEKF